MPFVRQRQAEKRRYQNYGSNNCEVHVYHHHVNHDEKPVIEKPVEKKVVTPTIKLVHQDTKPKVRMPSESLIPVEIQGFDEDNKPKKKSDYKGPQPEEDELIFNSGPKALFRMKIE